MDILPWTKITDLLEVCFSEYVPQDNDPDLFKGIKIHFRAGNHCPRRILKSRENCPTDLSDFAEIFDSRLSADKDRLLAEHPSASLECQPDEVVIAEPVATSIVYTVSRWRTIECDERLLLLKRNPPIPGSLIQTGLCTHDGQNFQCGCALPVDRRKVEAFSQRFHCCASPLCYKVNQRTYSIGLLETLILHGEMKTALRICKSAKAGVSQWQEWRQKDGNVQHAGWLRLMRLALHAYVVLNVLYTLCRNSDPATEEEILRKYRNTGWYQNLLLSCVDTKRGMFVPSLPHRDFLGLGVKTKNLARDDEDEDGVRALSSDSSLSMVTFEQFMSECEDIDSDQSINCFNELCEILRAKGLPNEVTNIIIGFLYEVPWNTAGVDDPLAPRNHTALKQYLDYCWTVVVRCFAVSSLFRVRLSPQSELSAVLYGLNRFQLPVPQHRHK